MKNERSTLPVHAQRIDEVLRGLDVDPEKGLDSRSVKARRSRYGKNRLRRVQRRSTIKIVIDQFKSMVVILLSAAAVLAAIFQRWTETLGVLGVIVINTFIGFMSEWRAVRSMEALKRMGKRRTRVRRNGKEQKKDVEDLTPGDIVLLEGGDVVPADFRLIESNKLRVDESVLTGESEPVIKQEEAVEADAVLAERRDMLYRGTTIVEGSGTGAATSIGMDTELGRISKMAEEAESEETPLEQRLNRLAGRLAWITVGTAGIVAAAGLSTGKPTILMIETAIALGVAAIPEGLPIVSTIALARGMKIMAKRHALINRLTAVETLGAAGVIFTDKTGTLTENRMTVNRILANDDELVIEGVHDEEKNGDSKSPGLSPLARRILETGVLCSNASLNEEGDGQGDPTELALLRAGLRFGFKRGELLKEKPEEREEAFDPELMLMATFHDENNGWRAAVKGAPQAVLSASESIAGDNEGESRKLNDEDRERIQARADELANQGFRMLAMADKQVERLDAEPYSDLRLLGMVALYDPPRRGVNKSIEACRRADIAVIMVTGDKPETARAIGSELGLIAEKNEVMHGSELENPEDMDNEQKKAVLGARIFARVSPEQKLNLVSIFQNNGQIVGMTGDGVNDVPALKKADIGIAMGQRGSDAARQTGDMVLKDDAFSSIVSACEQGRIIFNNIRKSVMFMLCTNIAEILLVTAASLSGLPLPLLPLQILYLNMLTDVFPALALGVGKGDPNIMEQPPRPADEPVLTKRRWTEIAIWSVIIACCVLGALILAKYIYKMPQYQAVTISFLTLAFAKLWFVFNLRNPAGGITQNDVVRNPWIWAALLFCAVLLGLAVYLPGLSDILNTRAPGLNGWGLVLGMSIIPLVLGQIRLIFTAKDERVN